MWTQSDAERFCHMLVAVFLFFLMVCGVICFRLRQIRQERQQALKCSRMGKMPREVLPFTGDYFFLYLSLLRHVDRIAGSPHEPLGE
jgi:hypothetical protein